MSILLWVIQVALAFLYFSGGAYKVFKFDEGLLAAFVVYGRYAL